MEIDILQALSSPTTFNPVMGALWRHFGDPNRFIQPLEAWVEPLLARPSVRGAEIINDASALVANFLRAVKRDPEAVTADVASTISEPELTAHYHWLVGHAGESLAPLLAGDPEWCDPKIAGWWAGDSSSWLAAEAKAVARAQWSPSEPKIHQCETVRARLSSIAASLSGPGPEERHQDHAARLQQLAKRLSGVTILCGDWRRAVSPTLLTGETAVLLSPPGRFAAKNPQGAQAGVPDACRQWALEHGEQLRIALCGRANDAKMPSDWEEYERKAEAGSCRSPERIWFSPGCKDIQGTLF